MSMERKPTPKNSELTRERQEHPKLLPSGKHIRIVEPITELMSCQEALKTAYYCQENGDIIETILNWDIKQNRNGRLNREKEAGYGERVTSAIKIQLTNNSPKMLLVMHTKRFSSGTGEQKLDHIIHLHAGEPNQPYLPEGVRFLIYAGNSDCNIYDTHKDQFLGDPMYINSIRESHLIRAESDPNRISGVTSRTNDKCMQLEFKNPLLDSGIKNPESGHIIIATKPFHIVVAQKLANPKTRKLETCATIVHSSDIYYQQKEDLGLNTII